jgi:hypothetical protein
MPAENSGSVLTEPAAAQTQIVGGAYHATATESLEAIAGRLRLNLLVAGGHGVLPAGVGFDVTADTTPTPGVLLINLYHAADARDQHLVRATMLTVFELASCYNRVDRTRPGQARFVVSIAALNEDAIPYQTFVGTMLATTTGEDIGASVATTPTTPSTVLHD